MTNKWQVGDLIHRRWEVHHILRGGMGIIYVVYDQDLHAAFAAKTFQDEIFANNQQVAERFTQESLSWINLDTHPNIVQANFVQIIGNKPYLFLEYVSEGDLSHWIGTPRLTKNLSQVLRFAIHLCDGMAYALSKGIKAHRDIKPQNCLITKDGTLKISDFGLAKTLVDVSEYGIEAQHVRHINVLHTRTGLGAGTPLYMSPEQFEDAKHVDVRADIYSFGVMLFEMVRGELPFNGHTWEELKHKHKTVAPSHLEVGDAHINHVIQTCLAKLPEQRFQDFREVREQLATSYERLTGMTLQLPALEAESNALQLTNKAASLDNLGYQEEALACFDRAIELNPNLASAWLNKGYTLTRLGRLDEALACYDRVSKLEVPSDLLLVNKGQTLFQAWRIEEALACFESALEINQHNVLAWSNKGTVLGALQRHEEGLICAKRAIELDPYSDHAWFTQAATLFNLKRHDDARKSCKRALELNPKFAEAWTLMGELELAAGNIREELACFDRALEINPQLADALVRKGKELFAIVRLDEALVCLDRATELTPNDRYAWSYKGMVLMMMRRFERALSSFKEAARLGDPNSTDEIELCQYYINLPEADRPPPWDIRVQIQVSFQKGVQLIMSQRWAEALQCFNRVLEMDSQHVDSWINKGFSLQRQGRSEEALNCLSQAVDIAPDYNQAQFAKGLMLLNHFGSYEEALACFERAQQLGLPQAGQAVELCLERLGRKPFRVDEEKP